MNLRDAVRRDISYRDPKSGKTYQLKDKVCLDQQPLLHGRFVNAYCMRMNVSCNLSTSS